MAVMRLDKLISNAGLATRSQCKKAVREGRVTVNGVAASDASQRCDSSDDIRLDGVRAVWQEFCYLMMNKPKGYLSVTEDERRETVLDLLSPSYKRLMLFPAGRLDMNSEGLLLLTNDGEFCHKVISPKSNITKEYLIRVARPFPENAEKMFEDGVVLEDGSVCRPAVLTASQDRLTAVVRISEGKYHQVKRMALAAGTRVHELKRLRIGGLKLDEKLAPGGYRELSSEEVVAIFTEKNA